MPKIDSPKVYEFDHDISSLQNHYALIRNGMNDGNYRRAQVFLKSPEEMVWTQNSGNLRYNFSYPARNRPYYFFKRSELHPEGADGTIKAM